MHIVNTDYTPGNPKAAGKLVVISGCSAGGKSTLLAELQRRGYPVAEEPGRQIVRDEHFVPSGALPHEDPIRFGWKCLERCIYFFNTARPEPVTFFDRSIVDAVANLRVRGVPDLEPYLEKYRYAETVFLAPPWPELFETDGERKHGFDAALEEYELLEAAYQEAGYTLVYLPKTGIASRADFLQRALGLG